MLGLSGISGFAALWRAVECFVEVGGLSRGHASAAMTLDLYGHLYEDALDRRYTTPTTPAQTRPERAPNESHAPPSRPPAGPNDPMAPIVIEGRG